MSNGTATAIAQVLIKMTCHKCQICPLLKLIKNKKIKKTTLEKMAPPPPLLLAAELFSSNEESCISKSPVLFVI